MKSVQQEEVKVDEEKICTACGEMISSAHQIKRSRGRPKKNEKKSIECNFCQVGGKQLSSFSKLEGYIFQIIEF